MVYLSITSSGVELTLGGEVVLCHPSWDDYEELLKCRQDHAAVKVRYDARKQEIRLMAPLPGHDNRSDTLSDLVCTLVPEFIQRAWQVGSSVAMREFENVLSLKG